MFASFGRRSLNRLEGCRKGRMTVCTSLVSSRMSSYLITGILTTQAAAQRRISEASRPVILEIRKL